MNLGGMALRNYSTWTRNDGNNTWDNIGTSKPCHCAVEITADVGGYLHRR